MDGVSVAASIISIATAGIQISIKLITLSTQISSASERVSSIGNDISLTSGVLHQLGELMTQKTTTHGVSIFSRGGLETTKTSAAMCERIFREIEKEFGRASEQLRGCRKFSGGKIKLSKSEKLKWPFLQPSVDILRADLREAKGTLMLMLQVTTLALSKKMADLNASASSEQSDIFRAIIMLQQQQDQKHRKDTIEKKRLSTGTNGSDPSKLMETSKSESVPRYCSAILADPPSSKVNQPLPLQRPTKHHVGTYHGRRESDVPEPAEGSSASIATLASSQPEKLMRDGYTSSSATLASLQSFQSRVDTVTPTSTMDSSSIHGGMQRPKNLQDYQLQLMHLEQQNKKQLISENEARTDLKASPAATKPQLSSEDRSDLRMFMLKPIVKDYFDKIELSWSIQNPKMHDSAIRNHLVRMEADGLPSVMDMLENLYDHEHSMIDAHQEVGELLSLKRIKTDIQHRDIVFQGVPGLQFVLESKKASKDLGRNLERTSLPPEDSIEDVEVRETDTGADLQGSLLNERGLVIGAEGRALAVLVEGDLKAVANRPLNAQLQIVDEFGRAIGSCALLPENMGRAMNPGPFPGLKDCIVASSGLVKDKAGNAVGLVVEGDVEQVTGFTVNEYGKIIDKFGKIQGRAELYVECEEQAEETVFKEYVHEGSCQTPIGPRDFGEAEEIIDPEEDQFSQGIRLRKMQQDMEKTFQEKVDQKESRYLQHEEELQNRRRELEALEIQRSNLSQAKLRIENRQVFDAEATDLKQPSRPFKDRKTFLKLAVPAEAKRTARTSSIEKEREDNSLDGQLVSQSSFKCRYDSCPYEGKSETDFGLHMKEAHWQAYVKRRSHKSESHNRLSTSRSSSPTAPRHSEAFGSPDFMFNEATSFASDLNDPKMLEDFDFEQFLQDDDFAFTDVFDENDVATLEPNAETSNDLVPGSHEVKNIPAQLERDRTPTKAEVSAELQEKFKSLEEAKYATERTLELLSGRTQLLLTMAQMLEESASDIEKEEALHCKPNMSLQVRSKALVEEIKESNGMTANIKNRLLHADVKAGDYQHEFQALEVICSQLETSYGAMARKYAELKEELDVFKNEIRSDPALSRANAEPPVEIFKSFRVSMEDPVTKVLPAALKKYNIKAGPLEYALYVMYEDKEICLGARDKPLIIFNQLDEEGRKPTFMLRRHRTPEVQQIKTVGSAESTSEPHDPDHGEASTVAEKGDGSDRKESALPQEKQSNRGASAPHEMDTMIEGTSSSRYVDSDETSRPPIRPSSRSISTGIFTGEPIAEEPARDRSDSVDMNGPGSWDAPDSWGLKKVGDENLGRLREIDEAEIPDEPGDVPGRVTQWSGSKDTWCSVDASYPPGEAKMEENNVAELEEGWSMHCMLAEEELGEDEEYSDDDDDNDDVEILKTDDPDEIVDRLLSEYTTLFDTPRLNGMYLPGGIL